MAVPISVTNPDLLRHSTELFMDSGFSPLCQRMGAMVAFPRFEDFTRYGVAWCPDQEGLAGLPWSPPLIWHMTGGTQCHGGKVDGGHQATVR